MGEEKFICRPQKYSKISLRKRQKLVDLVINKSVSIYLASKRLCIKNSTAKLIIKRFKKDQTFFQSRAMKQLRIMQQKKEKKEQERLNRIAKQSIAPSIALLAQTDPMAQPFNNCNLFGHWNYFIMSMNYVFLPFA